MNDPLMPSSRPRDPRDGVEHALTEALANLSSRGARPSLVDVQQRARRRQRRRAAAMVGACAMVVLGGASVLALRHDHTPLAITAGDGSAPPATTIACLEVIPTTMPGTLPDFTTVSPDFGSTTTVDGRLLPPPTFAPGVSTTTDPNAELQPFVGNPCSAPNNQWRCQGPMSTTSDGWSYFQYCEQVFAAATTVPTATAIPGIPATAEPTTDPFTTYPPGDIVIATTAAIAPTPASNP